MKFDDVKKKAQKAIRDVNWPHWARYIGERMKERTTWMGVTAAAGGLGLSKLHIIGNLPVIGAVVGGIILILVREGESEE